MRKLVKLLMLTAIAILLSTAFCPAADARGHGHGHSRVTIGTSVHFGLGFYDPWFYDPWYYGPWPGPYYSPYYGPRAYQPYNYPPADYGFLETDVTPDTAEVWVDGKFFGKSDDFDGWFQSLKLPLGVHTAEFRLPGYLPYAVSFTITPEDTTTVEYAMKPAPEGYVQPAPPSEVTEGQAVQAAGSGTLSVTVTPGGAEISIDGEYKATSPDQPVASEVQLAPGRHDVKVTKPGYKDYFAETLVTGGGLVNMAVDLTPVE